MLECSAAQRAPGVPRLTQTSRSDMAPEWYPQKACLDDSASHSQNQGWCSGPLHTSLWSQTRWCKVYWLASTSEILTHCSSEALGFEEDMPVRMAKPSLSVHRLHPVQFTGQCPWQQSTGAEQRWESQPNQKSILLDPNLVHASKPALWFLSAATAPL